LSSLISIVRVEYYTMNLNIDSLKTCNTNKFPIRDSRYIQIIIIV